MLVFVDLSQARTVLCVVCVLFPVEFAAVGGPAAVGAFVDDGPALFVVVETYGAWGEFCDCFGASLEGWDGRLGEGVEQVVWGQNRPDTRFGRLLLGPAEYLAGRRAGKKEARRTACKEREAQH